MSKSDKHDDGMGPRIMTYRASVVGGTLEIRPDEGGGTSVTCTLPSHLAAQGPPTEPPQALWPKTEQ
jgi:nitrate/nitrite-specific signal transduction histidine kinase